MASVPLVQYQNEHRDIYINSLNRKLAVYQEILQGSDFYKFWDVIIITAIDTQQKELYEKQLEQKLLRGEIPRDVKYHVISDPPSGPKIGCGGSSLVVLDFLDNTYNLELNKYKILLIHAGGYSKRLPNHATSGKIFCPIPFSLKTSSQSITMLELKLITLIEFPQKMNPGVFLTCADDVELFDSTECDFTKPGFTALAHPSAVEIGLTHGVFVVDKYDKEDSRPIKCLQYLHKPTYDTMQQTGAFVDDLNDGQIFVDSMFYFDKEVASKLLSFYRSTIIDCEVDAYGDFLQPLGEKPSNSYFTNTRTTGGNISASLIEKRRMLFDILKGTPLQVIPYVPSLFIHIGTCKEYMEHLCIHLPNLGFDRFSSSQIISESRSTSERIKSSKISQQSCLMHTIISDQVVVGDQTVIEYSALLPKKGFTIGKRCILSQIKIPKSFSSEIPDNSFLHTIVIRSESSSRSMYVTISFSVDDDLKFASRDPNLVLLRNVPLLEIIKRLQLSKNDIWNDKDDFSIWNAKIFPVFSTPEESFNYSIKIIQIADSIREKSIEIPEFDWSSLERHSLTSIINQKDIEGQLQLRDTHEDDLTFYQIHSLFKKEICAMDWFKQMPFIIGLSEMMLHPDKNIEASKKAQYHLNKMLTKCEMSKEEEDILEIARWYISLSTLIIEISKNIHESYYPTYGAWASRLHKKAYSTLRDTIVEPFLPHSGTYLSSNPAQSITIPFLLPNNVDFPLKVGQQGNAKSPARIILAGGWSDTPPFCLEKGGNIVNMAIQIDNKLPISSTARIIQEPIFLFKSVDAKASLEISRKNLKDLFAYATPGNPTALHKACICFTLFPQLCVESRPLNYEVIAEEILQKMIGPNGIELITDVDIPQGSGLGTSSILILTCLRSLKELFGVIPNDPKEGDKEYNAVLAIEQLLTTGGGWQDQIGGGIPGLKFITTDPSPLPEYKITKLELSQKHVSYLNERMLVVWTGKTRIAKAILTNIVDHWFIRVRGIEGILNDIKDRALEMYSVFHDYSKKENPEIADNEFEKLGSILTNIRKLNIDLEDSIVNDYMNGLFSILDPYVLGSHLIGAGSGGYICAWLKKGIKKSEVADILKGSYPNASIANVTLWTG